MTHQAGVNTWFPLEERNKQDPMPGPQPARAGANCPAAPRNIVESVADAATFSTEIRCPEGKIAIPFPFSHNTLY